MRGVEEWQCEGKRKWGQNGMDGSCHGQRKRDTGTMGALTKCSASGLDDSQQRLARQGRRRVRGCDHDAEEDE